jgi:PPP family 3-phenylpropionic acid transporter
VRINAPAAYVILYALMYAAFGVASPFWPEYFRAKAMSAREIGLVLGAAMVVRLVAGPLVGRLADISGFRNIVITDQAVVQRGLRS